MDCIYMALSSKALYSVSLIYSFTNTLTQPSRCGSVAQQSGFSDYTFQSLVVGKQKICSPNKNIWAFEKCS